MGMVPARLVLALRTDPLDFDVMSEDAVVEGPRRRLLPRGVHGEGQVVDPPAGDAADVVMGPRVAVEARLLRPAMDLADEAVRGQALEVAVDGAEADARQLAPGLAVDPVRGGMVHRRADDGEDHLA